MEVCDLGVDIGPETILVVLRRTVLIKSIFHDLAQRHEIPDAVGRTSGNREVQVVLHRDILDYFTVPIGVGISPWVRSITEFLNLLCSVTRTAFPVEVDFIEHRSVCSGIGYSR